LIHPPTLELVSQGPDSQ